MSYQLYIPPGAGNINWNVPSNYSALNQSNVSNPVNIGNILRIGPSNMLEWTPPFSLTLTNNLNANNYNIVNASGVGTALLSARTTGGTIGVTESINFNDANASNRNVSGVNSLTATTINSTTSNPTTINSTTGNITTVNSTSLNVRNMGNPSDNIYFSKNIIMNNANLADRRILTSRIGDAGYGGPAEDHINFGAWTEMLKQLSMNGNNLEGIRGIPNILTGTGVGLVVNTGVLYANTSSIRFKENIKDFTHNTEAIYQLQPKTFNYKDQREAKNKDTVGYIAEMVNELDLPHIVQMDENDEPFSVNYAMLTIYIIEEMKKMHNEIQTLKTKVAHLESLQPQP